jgi:short-subunit dehydrogenase
MSGNGVAIVTGASSGIGMETAFALARRKYSLVLAARRAERLEEVAEKCRCCGAPAAAAVLTDVAVESQVDALVAGAVEEFGRIDVMVNNAGFGLFARAIQTTDAEMQAIFRTNFFGVFYGCKAVAPIMIRQRGGHIFNVSSIIGKRGTPFHGAYCATKFAVCGLSESMRVELAPCNVRVTLVCPALTETEFFEHSPRGRRAQESFRRFKGLMSAQAVGDKIAATVGKSKPELVFSAGGRLLALVSALWPRAADWMMSAYYRDLVGRLETEE